MTWRNQYDDADRELVPRGYQQGAQDLAAIILGGTSRAATA